MKRKLDLIIFDLDGTLYPANPELDRLYPEAAVRLLIKKTGGNPEKVKQEFLTKKAELKEQLNGPPTSTLTLFYYYNIGFEEYENTLDAMIAVENFIAPDPQSIAVLRKINRHYPIFLYTTNNEKVGMKILQRLGLADFFPPQRRFTLTDAGRLRVPRREKLNYIKPGEKGFTRILELHNVPAERTLMVGDSEVSDIQPAQKLGLHTYHVTDRQSFYRLPVWLRI
ncbi:MAG TPA: HAD family hydrolase [Candidatus Marinimicrobia bacterium]|nr:HAD family hydrolase [Candidatus Neomarinimicrobiota bacterium]